MFYNTILFLIYLVELLVLHFLLPGGEDLRDGEGLILPDRRRSFLRICRTSGKMYPMESEKYDCRCEWDQSDPGIFESGN